MSTGHKPDGAPRILATDKRVDSWDAELRSAPPGGGDTSPPHSALHQPVNRTLRSSASVLGIVFAGLLSYQAVMTVERVLNTVEATEQAAPARLTAGNQAAYCRAHGLPGC